MLTDEMIEDIKKHVDHFWFMNGTYTRWEPDEDDEDEEDYCKHYTIEERLERDPEDFSDFSHVNLISPFIGNPEKLVRVYANFIDMRFEFFIEDKLYRVVECEDWEEMIVTTHAVSWRSLLSIYSMDDSEFDRRFSGKTFFTTKDWEVVLPPPWWELDDEC